MVCQFEILKKLRIFFLFKQKTYYFKQTGCNTLGSAPLARAGATGRGDIVGAAFAVDF